MRNENRPRGSYEAKRQGGTEEEIANCCWRDSWDLASAQISPEASSYKHVAFCSSSMSLEEIWIAVTSDHSPLTCNDQATNVTGSSLTAPSRGFEKKKP